MSIFKNKIIFLIDSVKGIRLKVKQGNLTKIEKEINMDLEVSF